MVKTLIITFSVEYKVSVNTENEIVKEYDSIPELVEELISHSFSDALPVVFNGGVTVIDREVSEREFSFK